MSGRKDMNNVCPDGLGLILDQGSWMCCRLAGTEPVVRTCTEAGAGETLKSPGGRGRNLGCSRR